MVTVSLQQAESQLPHLVRRAVAGEHVVIAEAGRHVVRLVPVATVHAQRKGGMDRGLFRVPEDFDEEVPEITALFER